MKLLTDEQAAELRAEGYREGSLDTLNIALTTLRTLQNRLSDPAHIEALVQAIKEVDCLLTPTAATLSPE